MTVAHCLALLPTAEKDSTASVYLQHHYSHIVSYLFLTEVLLPKSQIGLEKTFPIPSTLALSLRDTCKHRMYSALRKYSAPLNFATFCHISGFKHKDIKLYFFVKNQQVGNNHEVERHLLDISNFFNKSKTEKLGVQNYSAPLS